MTVCAPRFRDRQSVSALQIVSRDAFRIIWYWIFTEKGDATLTAGRDGLPDRLDVHGGDRGDVTARLGDWVIHHGEDEFTVMSPDEFARRYEPLPASATEPPVGETRAANQP